ncbi:Outer Dynein Arm Light Chain 1 [Thraustotheca clavata]|uniref:Outer Dynein Arm Light Chain 1 n=1 Tax=Thraustotheca clavata TaxID=74557 RepID=A0A1W0A1R4_9STRA|nr:Outer Dynein Arm Light Chain 1 [Thraustotheca clavata]
MNVPVLAPPTERTSGVSNAKAIGLFSKISSRKGAPMAAKPCAAPNVVSRLNDKVILGETHFPDFFENVKNISQTNRRSQSLRANNFNVGTTPKWSTNNIHEANSLVQQPASARVTMVRKAEKQKAWKETKTNTEISTTKAVILPERPSTAGQLNSNNREIDQSLSSLKGYVRMAQDRMQTSTASNKPPTSNEAIRQPSRLITSSFEANKLITRQPPDRPSTSHGGMSSFKAKVKSEKEDIDPEITFGETPDIPGVPVVFRSQKSRNSDPERLNLDRRALKIIPLLEGEHLLRLLNLQNNGIVGIDNLLGLPNLIFLDLYNNQIERIDNLHVVPNLRVLMLGKNRLKRIENLECLTKLDVLDLHSNDIQMIEDLNRLSELRVLNLAGNRIKALENIAELSLLTELNLRRNSIDFISHNLGKLISLQRLFLSNNRLESKESILPLFQLTALTELRLDGNPFNQVENTEYRPLMIQNFVSLRNLDLKVVTEDERREAFSMSQRATEKRREQQREDNQEAQRIRAITAVRKKWEEQFDARDNLGSRNPWQLESSQIQTDKDQASIQIGFSEVEVSESARTLYIYGDALEALESPKITNIVTAIVFKYVPIPTISNDVLQGNQLRSFIALRRLEFAHNQITNLEQLEWLAQLGQRCEELVIQNNPVSSMKLLRPFIAHVLRNVSMFNQAKITPEEQQIGSRFFESSPIVSKPTTNAIDKTSVSAFNACIKGIGKQDRHLKILNNEWAKLVRNLIKETLEETQDVDAYMAKCLDRM